MPTTRCAPPKRFDPVAFRETLLEDLSEFLPTEAGLLERYRWDPVRYIQDKLGWSPWGGSEERPGQLEIIQAYQLALQQQEEKTRWEAGEISESELRHWRPGQTIQYRLRVEAGHTVGKTKLSSGLVNHFFDCFPPAIIYTFAPTWQQIHDLLWKEIKTDRRGKGLPGRILDLELKVGDNHFAKGAATNDSGGRGTERIQGQHGQYLMFILDEAEGIPDFVWGAVDSMASGGIVIVLMLANPRTRSSKFHRAKDLSSVKSFRISCLQHPNVTAGRELIPGAVKRHYVEGMIEAHCEVVASHEPDDHTFDLPFPVRIGETEHPAGVIFKPNAEFMFRVMGIAPANLSDNTFCPVGRYEAAKKRPALGHDVRLIRMGVDVSRYGKDFGTLYIRHASRIWRAAQFWKQDTHAYAGAIKTEALKLKPPPGEFRSLHIRVDGGGGFGGGVIDALKNDRELRAAFVDFQVIEVHFNGTPHDGQAYDDLVTEMYAQTAETLKGVHLQRPPNELEGDLCERTFKWVNRQGTSVKRLEDKEAFKKRLGRSPDDGDGCVLCASPDFLFRGVVPGLPAMAPGRPAVAGHRPHG